MWEITALQAESSFATDLNGASKFSFKCNGLSPALHGGEDIKISFSMEKKILV